MRVAHSERQQSARAVRLGLGQRRGRVSGPGRGRNRPVKSRRLTTLVGRPSLKKMRCRGGATPQRGPRQPGPEANAGWKKKGQAYNPVGGDVHLLGVHRKLVHVLVRRDVRVLVPRPSLCVSEKGRGRGGATRGAGRGGALGRAGIGQGGVGRGVAGIGQGVAWVWTGRRGRTSSMPAS